MFYDGIAIGIGGAFGAVARFLVYEGIHHILGRNFPYGILTANILGCFLMGFLSELFVEKVHVSMLIKSAILVGFLGSFTTFSSFTIESFQMIQSGFLYKALPYLLLTIVLTFMATWVGVILGKSIS